MVHSTMAPRSCFVVVCLCLSVASLTAAQTSPECAPLTGGCKQAAAACMTRCMTGLAQKQGHSCEARHCSECDRCVSRGKGAACATPCSDCEECKDNASGCKAKCEWRATSCEQTIDAAQLNGASSSSLRLMRNEIFARYGYVFRSQLLTIHFSSMAWYEPRCGNVDGLLSKNEKARIDAIKKAEQARSSRCSAP